MFLSLLNKDLYAAFPPFPSPPPQLHLSSTLPHSFLFALSQDPILLFSRQIVFSACEMLMMMLLRSEKPSNTGSYSRWGRGGLNYRCHGESEPCFLFNYGDRMTSLCVTVNNKPLPSYSGEQAVYVHHYGHLDGKTRRWHRIRRSVSVRVECVRQIVVAANKHTFACSSLLTVGI